MHRLFIGREILNDEMRERDEAGVSFWHNSWFAGFLIFSRDSRTGLLSYGIFVSFRTAHDARKPAITFSF
jgi:hypothetical protein